jgi:hypothetical protein
VQTTVGNAWEIPPDLAPSGSRGCHGRAGPRARAAWDAGRAGLAPAGRRWRLGKDVPAATVRTDAVGYLRAVSGRDDHPALEVDGDLAAAAAARVVF